MGRCTVRGAQAVTSKEDAFVHVAFFHKRRTGKLRHVVKQKKKRAPLIQFEHENNKEREG